jgi:hypothetical protein
MGYVGSSLQAFLNIVRVAFRLARAREASAMSGVVVWNEYRVKHGRRGGSWGQADLR